MRWMEDIHTETGNGLKELRELVESLCSSGHQEPRKAERMTSSSSKPCSLQQPLPQNILLWQSRIMKTIGLHRKLL